MPICLLCDAMTLLGDPIMTVLTIAQFGRGKPWPALCCVFDMKKGKNTKKKKKKEKKMFQCSGEKLS